MADEMEVIILAAGEGTRFKSDHPKHLIEIGGEKVLARTIRLFLAEGAIRLRVIVPPKSPDYILVRDNRVDFVERKMPVDTNMDKFAEALLAASQGKNLVIVWGDVFFTRSVIREILNQSKALSEIKFFCRHGSNPIINAPWGEIFAAYIPTEEVSLFGDSAKKVKSMYLEGEIWRDGTWELAKFLSGVSPKDKYRSHPRLPIYHELSGITDDIDFQEDAARLRSLIPDSDDEIKERYFDLLGEIAALHQIMAPFGLGKRRSKELDHQGQNPTLGKRYLPESMLRGKIEKQFKVRFYQSKFFNHVISFRSALGALVRAIFPKSIKK